MDQLTTEQIISGLVTAGFWAACVAWAWYIAVEKNRWWYEGFWMGATLGPFGVIAAACMPTMPPAAGSSLSLPGDDNDKLEAKRISDKEWANRKPSQGRKPNPN
jgi:hypothetical protein